MKAITLLERHIPILTDENLRDEFVSGITSILQGKEPQASCTIMETVFFNLVHGPTAKNIPGIPKFDPTGLKKNDIDRYNKVQAGKVPSNGLGHGYKGLIFKSITTLPKEYREGLYADCLSRLKDKQRTAGYRRFIGYLAEVIKYCDERGEL